MISILAPNFANHPDSSSSDHLPNALHGREITIKIASESGFSGPLLPSLPIIPRRRAPQWSTIGVMAAWHDLDRVRSSPISSVGMPIDPWPLIRKRTSMARANALHLVVHGRSGGAVPACIHSLISELRERRQAPIQLETLTADSIPPTSVEPVLLVPLLLWPGAHVRQDLPAIRRRLRLAGNDVTMLPFLGAWPLWWQLVASLLDVTAAQTAVLVHHPLRSGVADRFLAHLSNRLERPLIALDRWAAYQHAHPGSVPLPIALAPNRMTEALSEADGLPPLLDHSLIRQGLIDLLAALP